MVVILTAMYCMSNTSVVFLSLARIMNCSESGLQSLSKFLPRALKQCGVGKTLTQPAVNMGFFKKARISLLLETMLPQLRGGLHNQLCLMNHTEIWKIQLYLAEKNPLNLNLPRFEEYCLCDARFFYLSLDSNFPPLIHPSIHIPLTHLSSLCQLSCTSSGFSSWFSLRSPASCIS